MAWSTYWRRVRLAGSETVRLIRYKGRVVSFFMPAQIGKQKGEKNMGIWELLILAVGLAMDAFAVSICKGLSIRKLNLRHMVIVGVWFGAFQALMPLLGYFLGSAFTQLVQALDHWIAFVLLLIIGGNMIREAFSGNEEEVSPSLAVPGMFLLAVATSIDALAVGITFAFLYGTSRCGTHDSTDLHTFCYIIRMVNFFDISGCQSDLVSVFINF